MLVRIDKDWSSPDFKRQSPTSSGIWEGITFTDEPVKECDLLIVFNSPNKDIKVKCPAGNKWLFTQESPIELYQWHTDSFKYFDKVFTYWDDSVSNNIFHEQTALPWHIGKSYDELIKLSLSESVPFKNKLVSWVTSNASHKEGHKLRMSLKDYLEQQHFEFDLFGRGFNPIPDKFDGIAPYKYSLAIENYACQDYWTEKIADCFLSWTIPIYWGATNIHSYFPTDSMIRIDPGDLKGSLEIIREAIDSNFYDRNFAALAEARNLILNKYQMFPHICTLINKYSSNQFNIKVNSYIPANSEYHKNQSGMFYIKTRVKKIFRL